MFIKLEVIGQLTIEEEKPNGFSTMSLIADKFRIVV
jgi:hypothetical protein